MTLGVDCVGEGYILVSLVGRFPTTHLYRREVKVIESSHTSCTFLSFQGFHVTREVLCAVLTISLKNCIVSRHREGWAMNMYIL